MNHNLTSLSHQPLIWHNALPPDFKGWRLPGSNSISATGPFGSVCIQEFRDEHFSIRLNVFDILQQFVIKSKEEKHGLCSTLMLKGEAQTEINSIEKYDLLQNQFYLIEATGKEIVTIFRKKLHITFDALFSKKLLDELSNLFSILRPSNKATVQIPPRRADTEILDITTSIFRCKYKNDLRRHYFESKVKDLLFKYLVESASPAEPEKQATEKELQAINRAEQLISSDLSVHYSIPELAKQVLLNEFRFKQVFKFIFGYGPYEYLIRKRMEKAKELLETGLSIKETAAKIGYRPSDFTTAFRNQFGFPPSFVKKKPS